VRHGNLVTVEVPKVYYEPNFVEEKENNNDFEKVKILFDSFSKNDCHHWCKKVRNQKYFFKNIFYQN
jgi:hypothetical protein